MEVEKINFQGVQPETEQIFQGKKSVQSDIRESHDEEKRNAAKLMKGTAALAVLAAAGIIGHKTGAFKKLGKMISGESSQLGKNAEKAADEAAEAVTNAGKKAEETVTEAVKSTNKAAEKVSDKVQEAKPAVTETVEKTTAKPVQDNAEKVVNKSEKAAETLNEFKRSLGLLSESLNKKALEKNAAKPVKNNAERIANKAEKTTESVAKKTAKTKNGTKTPDKISAQAYEDDILNTSYKKKGTYGQDLDDMFDPRNEDDILSPYYKRKGTYGQDLDDMFDTLNKQDPMSPWYDPFGTSNGIF